VEKHLLPQIPLQLHRKPLPVPIILVGADNSLTIPHKLTPHMQGVAVEGVCRGVAQWPQRKLHVLWDAVYLDGGQEGNLYVLNMPRRPTPCWIAPHFGRQGRCRRSGCCVPPSCRACALCLCRFCCTG